MSRRACIPRLPAPNRTTSVRPAMRWVISDRRRSAACRQSEPSSASRSARWPRHSGPPCPSGRACALEQLHLNHPRDHVVHELVALLDPRGVARRHRQQKVAVRSHLPGSDWPVKPDRDHARAAARPSAARTFAEPPLVESATNVAGRPERLDLASEHVVVGGVVGDRCEHRRVGRQRDGRPWTAVDSHPVHELGSEVLSVGRAAAVAADQQLSALLEAGAEPRDDLGDERR